MDVVFGQSLSVVILSTFQCLIFEQSNFGFAIIDNNESFDLKGLGIKLEL